MAPSFRTCPISKRHPGALISFQKEFALAEQVSCLVARQNGQLYAVGNKCTHYGANLVNGALGQGVVTCPWHGACFSLQTGDIEDFPGLDSLPKYDVQVENGEVKVLNNKLF